MRAGIYQPAYFPRLHYFNRILSSDFFVILDQAQYTKNFKINNASKREKTFQSDTPIKTELGQTLLNVPVFHEGYLPINKTKIDFSQKWTDKHLAKIKSSYKNATNFNNLYPEIKRLLKENFSSLADLNTKTIVWSLSYLFNLKLRNYSVDELNKKIVKAQSRIKKIYLSKRMNVKRPLGNQMGTEWTIEICKKIKASEYIYGETAGKSYMKFDLYKQNGIKTMTQDWICQKYPQQFEKVGFIPNLSILDLIFNVDRNYARKILEEDT